jgi:hypothetical protein
MTSRCIISVGRWCGWAASAGPRISSLEDSVLSEEWCSTRKGSSVGHGERSCTRIGLGRGLTKGAAVAVPGRFQKVRFGRTWLIPCWRVENGEKVCSIRIRVKCVYIYICKMLNLSSHIGSNLSNTHHKLII